MALPRLLGCLAVATLAACWTACGDPEDKGGDKKAPSLDSRCEQLAAACGDKDKHVTKLVDQCTQAATQQIAAGCADKAVAAYDCFEKQLCGKADKVWALDDFRVLADRHGKCVAEVNALRDCVAR
jgi:hypothetical protein